MGNLGIDIHRHANAKEYYQTNGKSLKAMI